MSQSAPRTGIRQPGDTNDMSQSAGRLQEQVSDSKEILSTCLNHLGYSNNRSQTVRIYQGHDCLNQLQEYV
jgi:hypothetical protein